MVLLSITLSSCNVVTGGLALFIFVSLFGDSSIFRGTPVHWLHWLFTKGACQGFW